MREKVEGDTGRIAADATAGLSALRAEPASGLGASHSDPIAHERALMALQGSIEKWERIIAGEENDAGPNNCALCAEFRHDRTGRLTCTGCPVKRATGRSGCAGTPYDKWENHDIGHNDGRLGSIRCPECARFAQAELDFLKSLLPAQCDGSPKGGDAQRLHAQHESAVGAADAPAPIPTPES